MPELIRKYVCCCTENEYKAVTDILYRYKYISEAEFNAHKNSIVKDADFSKFCYLFCVWREKSDDTWSSAPPLEIERKRWEEAIAEICRIKEKYGYDTDIPHFISGYDFLHDAEKRKRWEDITTDFESFLTTDYSVGNCHRLQA